MRKHREPLKNKMRRVTIEELRRPQLLRYIKSCCLAPLPVRQYALLALNLKNNFLMTRTKIHTFCLVTGRIRYTIRDVYVSRLVVGDIQREGNLVGYSHGS